MLENQNSFTQDEDNLSSLLTLTGLSLDQNLSQSADDPPAQSGCVGQERHALLCSLTSCNSGSASARPVEMESFTARKKSGYLRQENACLSLQNEQLISDLDAVQYELSSFKSQADLRSSRMGVKNNVAVMSEQICHLQAEVEAQAKDLKAAELKADCSQEAAAHSDIVVANLTEELSTLREELVNTAALGKRAEQQRNQALQNAEKLKEAFKDYKATISIKLNMVMESEGKLKESLIECDREKEELEMKCAVWEREKVEQNQTISRLQEGVRQAESVAAGFKAQLEEAGRKALYLEGRLKEQGAECRELASLRKQLEELQTLTHTQEHRVTQSHREAQQSQAELASLEAALALLHLREVAVGQLCIRPCMLPPMDFTGTAHLLKLKPGEGYQQLLRALQSIEAERNKQNNLVDRLQERLSRAQEEISTLQSSMAQRASHYQSLHTELLDKVSQATDTEKELKRKSARAAALEKQLQEKTSAYSQAALTNTELENQLQEKSSTLQHYQSLMNKKQKEYQQSLDKCKKSHSQQFNEQQHRIEMLQLSVEEAQSRVLEMEQELSSLQRERDDAQKAALLLRSSLDQLTQQRQVEERLSEEFLQSLKKQEAQSATKVCELQSSLSACREELSVYLQRTEEVKKNYESDLHKNMDKVSSLQEKLHRASLECQSSSEQNLQLQLSLQQQQTMLAESTAHISELEESQSQLQTEVSSLEQQLERARAALQEEVRIREQEVQERDKDLQETKQQNTQLSESVSHLNSEMKECQGELLSKESELKRLRRDIAVKTSHISRMEETLRNLTNQLERKNEIVVDLEEKLHRCDADRLNSVQRVQVLGRQLQDVRRELADTLEQLQTLRDVLQRTQTTADERQETVEKLTFQLSETQRELEERTNEVLDMDNALKERQGELQQRAQLLAQLEVAIRDHKQEMEKKVEAVQQSLEARERELREFTDRNLKESQQLTQQLSTSQQKLQTVLQELEETRCVCEALSRELDATKLQNKDKEVQLSSVEEELALKEARWLQLEADLRNTITSLEVELEVERERHNKELESVQQTRGQLLKVSEQMSSTMRSSQEQLAAKLQQSQNQLEQVKAECEQTKIKVDRTETELDRTRSHVIHLQAQGDQTQAELLQSKTQLEQTRILYEQSRAQNSHLHGQLEQLSVQLNQARVQTAALQDQLWASEKKMETSSESLLIKESEVTRLQARLSSLERAADRQNLFNHSLCLPAMYSSQGSSSPHSPQSSPRMSQTTAMTSNNPLSAPLFSPTPQRTCLSPLPHTQPFSAPFLSNQTCDWLQRSSIDSSLDFPLSLKATLRELSKQPLESTSPSASSFSTDTVDHSWQGLSAAEATATPDLSFNPLTYMLDRHDDRGLQEEDEEPTSESRRESVTTLVPEEENKSHLTGMMKFVNETLAMQEDLTLWSSSTARPLLSQSCTLQVTTLLSHM
ncbi:coiled-coil domain-containing protein 18 [Labrus mixtus]|uniref:coiled-coil domain-containing protein 18 n=1 Tax=Labrus mixtus TaxID=508554 RepID=UPI0029C0B03A|nr:coiled-coil domain-containing protein 18 [Labrus mixtus]